ncbi:MAG: hypothetical protein IPM71_15810 [Bacteroidota bacterium]|nr:MAG: hypothetical protein IPM71_15810 [Bacteroidota bacterium]
MKKILIILGLVTCISAFSQEYNDTTNIYYKSLKLHIAYLKSNVNNGSNNVIVEYNEQTTINLPTQIDNFKISYSNRDEIKKLSAKEAIQLIVIKPVVINQNRIFVNIIDFTVNYKRGNFNYVNCGGSKIEFKYDCLNNYFKVENLKQGGI